MTTNRESLLGIPEETQAGVDTDLLAWTRGPATLDRTLDALDAATIRARYVALLGRYELRATTGPRRAWEDFNAAHDRADRTGGMWAR